MLFISIFKNIKSNSKILYTGFKLITGSIFVYVVAPFVKTFEGDSGNSTFKVNPDRDANKVFLYSYNLTFSDAFAGIGLGLLLSGSWDIIKMGANTIEASSCANKNSSTNVKAITKVKAGIKNNNIQFLPKNNKKKRSIEKRILKNKNKEENEHLNHNEYKKQLKVKIFFASKIILEMGMIGYFIITLIQPIKEWFDTNSENTDIQAAENSIKSFFNGGLNYFKDPEGVIETILSPSYSVFISLCMFSYNIIEGRRISNRSEELQLTERPIAGILNGLGYLLLSESAFILHSKILHLSRLHATHSTSAIASIMEKRAKQEYYSLISSGMDPDIAAKKAWSAYEVAMEKSKHISRKIFNEKLVWVSFARIANIYAKFKFTEAGTDALFSYLRMRKEEPLQKRLIIIKKAFIERVDRKHNFSTVMNNNSANAGSNVFPLFPKPPEQSNMQFPEEPLNPGDRQRKLDAKKARALRAAEKENMLTQKTSALEFEEQQKIELQKQKEELLKNIYYNLNPTSKEWLLCILRKGKHLELDSSKLQLVFGEPEKPKLDFFEVQSTDKGILLLYKMQDKVEVITSYHREHGKPIHERVFNRIRHKFEEIGITTEELELYSKPKIKI